MPPDTAASFFGFISNLDPAWGLAFLIGGILAWQSPKIIRELRRKPHK